MKTAFAFFLSASFVMSAQSFAAKPKGKPPAKNVGSSVTVKDLALREAKSCDSNRNGRIDAFEMSQLRMAQSKNPKSYLYLFDDNGNKYLDDSEIGRIKFAPGAKPKKK